MVSPISVDCISRLMRPLSGLLWLPGSPAASWAVVHARQHRSSLAVGLSECCGITYSDGNEAPRIVSLSVEFVDRGEEPFARQ